MGSKLKSNQENVIVTQDGNIYSARMRHKRKLSIWTRFVNWICRREAIEYELVLEAQTWEGVFPRPLTQAERANPSIRPARVDGGYRPNGNLD
jgi:hypothetical protein